MVVDIFYFVVAVSVAGFIAKPYRSPCILLFFLMFSLSSYKMQPHEFRASTIACHTFWFTFERLMQKRDHVIVL